MQGHIAQLAAPPLGRPALLRYSVYGGVALALLTVACFQLRLDLATTAFLYLIVIVLLSLKGSFLLSAVLSLIACGCLAYYFAPPVFSFETTDPLEAVAIPAFLITSAVITRLVATVRKSAEDAIAAEASLRKQADLLDLTHDTVFVRDSSDVISFWNHGAEEQYGWTREEALGRVTHELLRTVFPAQLEEINDELTRTGRWEGELVHTRRDGTQIVVASRWALQSDSQGSPDGRRLVLETNRDITERKRAEQALEELAGRLIRAQEEERSRIGRELHDHISQTLGVLTIKIDQLRADDAITPRVAAALEDLRRDTSGITGDVHRLSHRLHSSMLDYLGLVPALQKLVSEFSDRHGIPITFTHASMPAPIPSEVALCLFRVAEESLTNIGKHSKAPSARVHVAGAADGIRLTVQDAGEGFDVTSVESKAGLGFISMQERLRVLRGTIRIDSAPSRGTRIDVWVPPLAVAGARNPPAQRSEIM